MRFFFFEENSVDSKYSLLWRFFFLSMKCYCLPMGLITFRSEHGWNRLTVFFKIIYKNLEIYDIFVHRCLKLEKCAMRRGAKMFVAKVSINIWDHAYLAQEQFWKLINFRFFDCEPKKKFGWFYVDCRLTPVLKSASLFFGKKILSIQNYWYPENSRYPENSTMIPETSTLV